jgi:threonylcarbamoyladenosine tRNA methylthiotransferase MtaB
MATFSMRVLGCKVSFADAQAVRERLLEDGHAEVPEGGEIQVVNTCCVTHEAVSKSRQAVGRAARSARTVYLTGCASRLEGAFDGAAANVVVTRRTGDEAAAFVAADVGAIGCVDAQHRLDRVRAFVRIRHREIVLTGVNLGCFRDRDAGFTLARLVREAGAIPGLERLRLSSIEVNHVDDALVEALNETPTVSPHLHVPLQSGDDGVLQAMGRRYSAAQFERRLAPLDGLNLTTDVIVGFPGEDDAAFTRTLELVERLGITKVHVFPYSPRPGTRTAAADTVPQVVKRERSARLRALSDELCRRRWRSRVGTNDRVLVDRPGRGYADDYTPWLLDAPVGSFVTARAVGVDDEGVLAVAA